DLMDRVWTGAIIGENALQVHISAVRKALGPYRAMLKTESGRGYRLLQNWTVRDQDEAVPSAVADALRETREPAPNNLPAIVTRLIGRLARVLWSGAAADDCFDQAAGMAREQGALFWELRIALSRGRLKMTMGRHAEARDVLRPVYDRFTERFAIADLRAGRTLLDSLPS
ncbi:MAG TPA: winged helix-turn-helix domain-containing protein, partial [Acetobacteraceae bacterium]|nr:winged helix-turn-helix domain-containing protein [Acetobacteraceae bacterium]